MSAQTPGSGTAEEEAATPFRSPEAAEPPPLSGAAELAAAAPATRISIAGLPWVDPKRSITFADAGDAQSRSASPAPKATALPDAEGLTTRNPLTIIRAYETPTLLDASPMLSRVKYSSAEARAASS